MEDKPNTNYHLAEAVENLGITTKRQGTYTHENKVEAVMAFFMTQSANKASKMCGVPASTIKTWKQTDWWEDTLLLVKKKKDAELDGKLTSLIDDLMIGLKTRVKEGDIKLNKYGEQVIVPVSARDQAAIAKVANDLRKGLRGQELLLNGDGNTIPVGAKDLETMLVNIVKDAKAEKSIKGETENVDKEN